MIVFPSECVVQGSPDWHELRRGIPTASGFDRILTGLGARSTQAERYAMALAADVEEMHPTFFTESPLNKPPNPAMINGTTTEPEARRWYEFDRDLDVRQVGFCLSDCQRFGCSPDGMIDPDGLLELKCPMPETQEGYVRKGCLPNAYRPQVHGQLLVTGRAWCDFASYCPGFDPVLVRVEPDDYTALLAEALDEFWEKTYRPLLERLNLLERFARQRASVLLHLKGAMP